MPSLDNGSAQAFQVGQKIRQLRLDSRFTPREFADELNKTQSFVARLEQGLADVDAATISKIAQIFGVSVWQILDAPPLETESRSNYVGAYQHGTVA